MMKKTWQHPELGKFSFCDGWYGKCKMPAFKVLRYRFGGKLGGAKTNYEIFFEHEFENYEEEIAVPDRKAVRLALKIIKSQDRLLAKTIQSLWEDFHGCGPGSDIWWNGDLHTISYHITEAFKPRPTIELRSPQDLHHLLGFANITVRNKCSFSGKPVAILNFDSPIDEEHGVGVLTDGTRVLGIGYQSDAHPFET